MALEWVIDSIGDMFRQEKPGVGLRRAQRQISTHKRSLDRQDAAIGEQERVLLERLRKAAESGESRYSLKLIATDISRIRKNRRTIQRSKNNVTAMENRIISAQSTQVMSDSFRSTTISMAQIANEVNPRQSHNLVRHFEKFNEEMSAFTSLIDDTMGDASLADGGEEMEDELDDNPDAMVDEILAEVGMDFTSMLPDIPSGSIRSGAPPHAERGGDSHGAIGSASKS